MCTEMSSTMGVITPLFIPNIVVITFSYLQDYVLFINPLPANVENMVSSE